jgi:hypothetical protein
MIRLDCSRIAFYSQNDEDAFFRWGTALPAFLRWYQDKLVLKGKTLSDRQLREVLAMFHRYNDVNATAIVTGVATVPSREHS